jgi:hypothetical protein
VRKILDALLHCVLYTLLTNTTTCCAWYPAFVRSQASLKAGITTTLNTVRASTVNVLQKAYNNSKTVAAVASAAGAVAGVYAYPEQLGELARFALNEVHAGFTRAASAVTEFIMTSMEPLEQCTGLTAWQV